MNAPPHPPIVDAHAHLFDARAVRYGVFEHRDPGFEALVGDYSALPRTFLLDDYLRSAASRRVEGIVWHEFIAEDAEGEAAWGEALAAAAPVPMALVGLVDLADPRLPERLERYGTLPHLTAVRQHLGWDARRPLRRMAPRPDLLQDPALHAGLARLAATGLRCGLEVFGPQLPDLLEVVWRHPDVGFTVAVMGWPGDLDAESFAQWRSAMQGLGRCDNARLGISAIECIFGMDWTEAQVAPWVLAAVEAFGPHRAMLGSHLPIDGLSHGFDTLYGAYDRILAGFSEAERAAMFGMNAREWFRLPPEDGR